MRDPCLQAFDIERLPLCGKYGMRLGFAQHNDLDKAILAIAGNLYVKGVVITVENSC